MIPSVRLTCEKYFFSFESCKCGALWALLETIKIIAIATFLNALSNQCPSPLLNSFSIIVGAPLCEEILFRGLLLSALHALQKGWNHFVLKRKLTEQEDRIQHLFRIHLTAFIFALVHYLDEGHLFPLSRKEIVCLTLWSYLAGVLYGHLTEKYHTLSFSLMAHGIHNFLAQKSFSFSFILAVANKLFFCLFLTPFADQAFANIASYKKHLQNCISSSALTKVVVF